MTSGTFSTALAREVKGAVVRQSGVDREQSVDVTCSSCGEEYVGAFTSHNRLPPEVIAKKLKQQGWKVGKKPVCPPCNEKPKENNVTKENTENKLEAVPTSIDNARRAKRNAIAWLEEAFDADNGRFRGDVTDESIGRDVGLSAKAVKDLREDLFGPIRIPSEIEALQNEAREIGRSGKQLVREAAAASEALDDKVNALLSKLDALIEKNGWKS